MGYEPYYWSFQFSYVCPFNPDDCVAATNYNFMELCSTDIANGAGLAIGANLGYEACGGFEESGCYCDDSNNNANGCITSKQ